jgi:hypothetical protein
MAKPMPAAKPVTNAVLSFNYKSIFLIVILKGCKLQAAHHLSY